jgi:CHAT domain-containing protein/predicted negative regulator of RcsB-dependent stress response
MVSNGTDATQISPNSLVHRDIEAGSKQVFRIHAEQGKLLRLVIDKGDLSISTTVYGPTDSKLIEQTSHEFETVEISVPVEVTGSYNFEVQSLERSGCTRAYELRVEHLMPITARDILDNQARQAFAGAEDMRATWIETSLRKAIIQYDRAAYIWSSVSDHANAARAMLRSGDTCLLVSEYRDAFERYRRALFLAGKTDDQLIKVRILSHTASLQSYLGKNDVADETLRKALALLERDSSLSDTIANVHGDLISHLAEVSYAKGDLAQSLKQYEQARKLVNNDRQVEARIDLFTGYIYGSIGEPERAVSEITQALNLYKAINNKLGEGLALTALGLSHSLDRDENRAIELHREAIGIFRSIGDKHSEAIALNALGQAYENLNEYTIALNNYENALRLFQTTDALDGAAIAVFKIARIYRLSGKADQALAFYERCLILSRAAGKARSEANALNETALLYIYQGRYKLAIKQYAKIREFYKRIGDRRGLATALNAYGDLLLQLGQNAQALKAYLRARPFSEKSGDKGILAATLYNLARVNRAVGSYDAALTFIKQSLELIEDLRTNVETPDLRASYFSGVKKYYELGAEILMGLEQLRPGRGFATEALLLNERARSRSLLDLLDESQRALPEDAPKQLLEREHELRGLIRAQAQYAMDLSLKERDSSDTPEVANQLAQLRAEYQEVLAQLRGDHPRDLSLEYSPVNGLKEIQSELRDGSTLLLEYSLGEERSYLWAVSANSLKTYALPSRQTIEDAAHQLYKLLTALEGSKGETDNDYQVSVAAAEKAYFDQASALSEMVLGPVANDLGNKKLLLVTEGALQYVPFDALPVPRAAQNAPGRNLRLIDTNEVSTIPSVSTLIALRATKIQRSPLHVAAVIADPVFSLSDDRIPSNRQFATIATASAAPVRYPVEIALARASESRPKSLARLPHSFEEAEAILAAAPEGTTMLAEGFDATPEMINGRIGQYQILHFATHAFVDAQHPELSGIVLSMVDRNGLEKNGLMSLQDIYNLDLSAQLTVLSACQTGLGQDVKGEGLVGLTHSFMSAGSKTVVSSLWKVDDLATTTLMTYFYDGLLRQGMPTAAALRYAKLRMMQHKRWSAPYYWAGFTLQGEYLNRVVVEKDTSSKFKSLTYVAPALLVFVVIVFQRRGRRRPLA